MWFRCAEVIYSVSCGHAVYSPRPLNLPGQFIVRATDFYSEIALSHSEIPVQSSHNARFGGTNDSHRLVTQLGMDFSLSVP